MKYIEIKSAKYVRDYKIEFVFNDKTTKTVDFWEFMKNHKSPCVIPYKNLTRFKKFEIKNGLTISWNNYDMCFGVETIYKGNIPPPDIEKIKKITIDFFGKKKAEKMFKEVEMA